MIGLAHFFDNPVAGSSAGVEKHGLTPLGREVVARMQALGIAIDLAHVSPASVTDALALATEPVVVSHTGVRPPAPGRATSPTSRSRGVAATGGVIGIGYFESAVCGTDAGHIARAIRARARPGGHRARGARLRLRRRRHHRLRHHRARRDRGRRCSPTARARTRSARVMGENALRVLAETLPGSSTREGALP